MAQNDLAFRTVIYRRKNLLELVKDLIECGAIALFICTALYSDAEELEMADRELPRRTLVGRVWDPADITSDVIEQDRS